MKLSEFDFTLPRELIAAFPPEDRPSARLLNVNRQTGEFSHHTFRDIEQFLKPGDLLVLNDTKVMPARLFGRKITGGQVEILLLKNLGSETWKALIRPGGRVKKGTKILLGENETRLEAIVQDDPTPDSGERRLTFYGGNVAEKLKQLGHIPLPPYLDRPDSPFDREYYQTVYASKEGAVASPTAGLHFDVELLERLEDKGVEIAFVTLHVSYGTFQPITAENLSEHRMFEEEFEITEEAAEQVNQALAGGRRVIACGTTTVRTLESNVVKGRLKAGKGTTEIFIYPPYDFKIVSGLITNFHLPKSTLLLLVSAFIHQAGGKGREKLFAVYEEAVRNRYRFYSYGDAMVIM